MKEKTEEIIAADGGKVKSANSVKKKIMIVDDDTQFLEELNDMLSNSNYEMVLINDSTESIEAAKKEKPDLILLDLKMDKMNGFQVVVKLRQTEETAKTPIIIMTGYLNEEEFIWLEKMCGEGKCIKKPFNPLDILAMIEGTLS